MSSFLRRRKYGKEVDNTTLLRNGQVLLEKLITSCNGKRNTIRDFSAKELQIATNDYDVEKLISQHAHFKLYKGLLQDRPISIMKFEDEGVADDGGYEHCLNNIVFASQMRHKNVLKLIGCCLETEIPILVFESIEHGTLYAHISNRQPHVKPLPWKFRLKIAMEIASAVAYLHFGFPRPIVHKDINASHILLDEQYVAKLFDFSLSLSIPEGETHVEVEFMAGTIGYVAPEFFDTLKYNEKCDVYSFGGLLLVLLTGKFMYKVYDFQDEEDVSLAVYVTECYQNNKLHEIVDPVIVGDGTYPEKEQQLQAFTGLALKCYSAVPEDRPTMIDVAKQLRQIYKSTYTNT